MISLWLSGIMIIFCNITSFEEWFSEKIIRDYFTNFMKFAQKQQLAAWLAEDGDKYVHIRWGDSVLVEKK